MRTDDKNDLSDRSTDDEDRRVEILLNADLYDRVRIKAMRQRKSLRALGAELFEAWADDERASGRR